MSELPRFEYFDDPMKAKSLEQSDEPCACCGDARGWIYTGVIYGMRDDEPRVCPWCIADGSAASAWEGQFNSMEGGVAAELADAVEKRTPGFATWQDLSWPVCCDKPCVFRGYAQYEELTQTWPEAGRALLATYEPGWLGTKSSQEFLEAFRATCDPGAYAFQCRECGTWQVPWDCG